jgi:hypothetical protein
MPDLLELFDDGDKPVIAPAKAESHVMAEQPLTLDQLTGNVDRSRAIIQAVSDGIDAHIGCFDDAVIRTNLLNEKFGLSQEEYDVAVEMLKPNAPGEDAPPAMSLDEAVAERQRLVEALHMLKNAKKVAESAVKNAREALASAIMVWSAGGDHEAIKRAEIAAINHDRGREVEQQPRVLRSRLDQLAAWSVGGNAAEGRHRYGGSLHRPMHMPDGSIVRPGKRRLPSER